MSRKALVLLVCCCDFRDGAERLIPSKSLGNAVIRAFPGLFRILRMCAPRHAAAVVRPRERKKSADRRRRILISRLLIIRASVPRRKSPFPAYFKGFPAVSLLIPPYPAFLKYPVSPQQAASAGFDKPITAGDTWESSVILDAQKGTSVQVYCSTFFDENDDSGAAKEFVTGFKEWLNADSQKLTNNGGNDIVAAVSALGYDGYMVALEAIKAAGSTDGTAIRDALYGVNYDGVTGNITFDQTTGDANKDMAYIKKAADGAFEFVKTQSVEG